VSAQLFFQTGGRDGGPEARVPPARPVLQQQRSPTALKCHCGQNQVRCASINKGKKKDTRCKIDWGSEYGK